MDGPGTDALSYPELHKLGRHAWWRSILGVGTAGIIGMVVAPLWLMAALAIGVLAGGGGTEEMQGEFNRLVDLDLTPIGLTFSTLGLWMLIPAVWLSQWVYHRLPPGTLSSVAGRIRWRFLAVCLGLSVVAIGVTMLLGMVLPEATTTEDAHAGLNTINSTAWQFLVVIVLFVPLQAAAEEYAFRGYLMQAWGGVFGGHMVSRVMAVLGSALVFAAMHGSQELPIFLDRFGFGVVAGILVIVTGGLEAAIALHVVNNLFAFGVAVLFGDISAAMSPSGSTWWQVPLSLAQTGSFLLLAWWVARRMGIATTAPAAGPDVPPGPASRPVLVSTLPTM